MEDVGKYLRPVYGAETTRILKEVKKSLKEYPRETPIVAGPLWYKNIILYIAYPDSFKTYKARPLDALRQHLPTIKKLGCNALHVLPFLDSPMVDKGFDVRNFLKVHRKFGNNTHIEQLVKDAKKLEIRLFMDLVFNHVSDQHEWFKRAERGEEKYRNYFIHTKTRPEFIRKFHKKSAVWAEYRVNRKKKVVNIAFPEYTGEIPHWRKGNDEIWYYHTYYPQQLDVNWRNADVFIEFVKIVLYWAHLGFNFRLDAIPFVGKGAYKEVDVNNGEAHCIMAAINSIAKTVHPECSFIAETYESLDTVIEYFGNSNIRQAELSYNFHLCTNIWVTLITEDVKYIWSKMRLMDKIPKHAEWLNFLRNHDELSLAYLPNKLLTKVFSQLICHGKPFREGFGVAGRTYSLLGNSLKKFFMAYFLLASLPGGFALPYGDEFGITNVPDKYLGEEEKIDARNINRGRLTRRLKNSKKGKKVFDTISNIIQKSILLRDYLNVWPKKIETVKQKSMYAALYEIGTSQLIVLINLKNKTQRIKLDSLDYTVTISINNVKTNKKYITLGPYGGVWLQK